MSVSCNGMNRNKNIKGVFSMKKHGTFCKSLFLTLALFFVSLASQAAEAAITRQYTFVNNNSFTERMCNR